MSRLFVCAFLSFASACRDYAYRHDISGTVVDSKGAPVASAVVQRIDDKDKPYGVDELYKRTTNAKGEFQFVSEGRGPSPVPSAPWRFQVDFGNGETKIFGIDVPYEQAPVCTGYCMKSLVISK
jgi:hypothetical protein